MSAHNPQHYVKIWGILLVLLCISVAGPFLGIKVITLITAFGIALVKAYLVMKHFMHLDVERPIVHWLMATSLVLMVVFFAGVSPDVMNHEGQNWVNDAAKDAVARGIQEPHHGEHEAGAAGEHGDAVAEAEATTHAESTEPAAFDAAKAFNTSCTACHGTEGNGAGPAGAALNPPPANFTDPAFWAERDDERVFKAIKEGGMSVGKSPVMASWAGTYNDEQIHELVAYLHTFNTAAAPAGEAPAPGGN